MGPQAQDQSSLGVSVSSYGAQMRTRALVLPENDLRQAVDRLLEQCGREEAHQAPDSDRAGMLHVSEIYFLLGIGPVPGVEKLIELGDMIDRQMGGENG
jgi:hypothetical protein